MSLSPPPSCVIIIWECKLSRERPLRHIHTQKKHIIIRLTHRTNPHKRHLKAIKQPSLLFLFPSEKKANIFYSPRCENTPSEDISLSFRHKTLKKSHPNVPSGSIHRINLSPPSSSPLPHRQKRTKNVPLVLQSKSDNRDMSEMTQCPIIQVSRGFIRYGSENKILFPREISQLTEISS